MKKIVLSLFLAASSLNAQCYDPEKCLPPVDGDDNLFPKCKSFFGNIDFLYWTVNEGALSYAIQGTCCNQEKTLSPINLPYGEVKNGHFKARPGVRASIGYYNAPSYWEIVGEYTHLNTHGSDCSVGQPKNDCPLSSVYPLAISSFAVGNVGLDYALCNTEFKYQLGDLFVTRVFDPNPHLRMRFLAGITGAFLCHELNNQYSYNHTTSFLIQDHWNYKAGGLRLGVAADWWLHWKGLYLSGKATVAGFMGSYKNTFCESSSNETLGFLSYKDNRLAEHVQFLVGPSWQHVGKCFYYNILVGYELNGWFNLQQTPVIDSNRPVAYYKSLSWNTSSLALHGLTVRLNGGF